MADLGAKRRRAFGVFGYVIGIAALAFPPETHGRALVPVE